MPRRKRLPARTEDALQRLLAAIGDSVLRQQREELARASQKQKRK